jgi:hypothetical protein
MHSECSIDSRKRHHGRRAHRVRGEYFSQEEEQERKYFNERNQITLRRNQHGYGNEQERKSVAS